MHMVVDLAPPLHEQPLDQQRWAPLADQLEDLLDDLTRRADIKLDTMFGSAGALVAVEVAADTDGDASRAILDRVKQVIGEREFEGWSIVGVTWDTGPRPRA